MTKKSCDGGDHEYVIGCGETPEPELPTCNNECGGESDDTCD